MVTETEPQVATTKEQREAEAKLLYTNLLVMMTWLANTNKQFDRGQKKVFCKHLFSKATALRTLLEENNESITLGMRIQFTERKPVNGHWKPVKSV